MFAKQNHFLKFSDEPNIYLFIFYFFFRWVALDPVVLPIKLPISAQSTLGYPLAQFLTLNAPILVSFKAWNMRFLFFFIPSYFSLMRETEIHKKLSSFAKSNC